MKRVFWLPAGREIWFDLADRLEKSGVATPVLWLGDDALLDRARRRFDTAEVLALAGFSGPARAVPEHRSDAFDPALLLGPEWRLIRDHAFKLMDREDFAGRFTHLERDGYFYQLVSWVKSRIDALRPDLVFASEAPHGAASYVVFALARALGIRAVIGVLSPLLPVMSFREGIGGPAIALPRPPDCEALFRDSLRDGLENYATGLTHSPAYKPDYVVRLTRMSLPRRFAYWLKGMTGKRRAGHGLRRKLRATLEAVQAPLPERPFVYVPLQYEPERTTTPDGGIFFDQLKAIQYLRAKLPRDVAIVVKEHPSMFSAKNYGHLGRHARHLQALASLNGVCIVDMDTPSIALVTRALGVATVTGTVALEAALLGKHAVVFGAPWFQGCPNTTDALAVEDWERHFTGPVTSRDAVIAWLHDQAMGCATFGTPNPSGVKLFRNWYSRGDFARIERDCLLLALQHVIAGEAA